MDILTDPLLMRSIERMITIFGAIIFGFLGYKLFVLGVTSADARLEIKSKSSEFIFSGKAPGLFFMLFSSIILVISLSTGGAAREVVSTEKEVSPEVFSKIRTEVEMDARKQVEIQLIKRESRSRKQPDLDRIHAEQAAKLEQENIELIKKVESLEKELMEEKRNKGRATHKDLKTGTR